MQMKPIGTIYTPFKQLVDMPIQPVGGTKGAGIAGRIVLDPELVAGLKDLDGFSHIFVLYHFHRVTRSELTVTPFLDPQPRGIFATRAPTRPNPIGLSVLAVSGISGNTITVENVDILDGTPLLDIKPYVPAFDQPTGVQTGWLQQASDHADSARSDHRFL